MERFSEMPIFSSRLKEFIHQIKNASDRFDLASFNGSQQDAQRLIHDFFHMMKFLAGSSSKRIPYEIAYCLEQVLLDWQTSPAIVSTALASDLMSGFYFQGMSPQFYKSLEVFLNSKIEDRLVQISLPEIYRHSPIFCTPLYHELGHYIDVEYGITTRWMLQTPLDQLDLPGVSQAALNSLPREQVNYLHKRHRMEYFADLFAASYVGDAVDEFLVQFTGADQEASMTHPATKDRSLLVKKFLSGEQDDVVLSSLQEVLIGLKGFTLEARFSDVNVEASFNNMRPVDLRSKAELHGIFPSAWSYLEKQLNSPFSWAVGMQVGEIEKLINNLVEKSIRNYMIKERWESATT